MRKKSYVYLNPISSAIIIIGLRRISIDNKGSYTEKSIKNVRPIRPVQKVKTNKKVKVVKSIIPVRKNRNVKSTMSKKPVIPVNKKGIIKMKGGGKAEFFE